MKIPIIKGTYAHYKNANYGVAYPINMRPIVLDTGISQGYLKPISGIVKIGTGPGRSRGAIVWKGVHYRVMGDTFCKVLKNGETHAVGYLEDDGKPVSMAYSIDKLAIASAKKLYYFDMHTVYEDVNTERKEVLDVVWIDGYFMTTDGKYLVVNNLSGDQNVNVLNYGDSEIDPDPIVALVKLKNEIYAVNRYTIEVFDNTGTSGFPFSRIESAQIGWGALGTHCVTVYESTVTFLGSGVGESPGIFMATAGTISRISTQEIDDMLSNYSEEQLSEVVLETVTYKSQALLWVRLPDKTLVFDLGTSKNVKEHTWYIMNSGEGRPFRGIDIIWCYDTWQVGDLESSDLGVLSEEVGSHFERVVKWEFSTKVIYNNSKGAIVNSLELVGLPGRVAFGTSPVIDTSYSLDGVMWSQKRSVGIGYRGDRLKRIVWRKQGSFRNFRIQKFSGDSDAYLAVSCIEAELEGLR